MWGLDTSTQTWGCAHHHPEFLLPSHLNWMGAWGPWPLWIWQCNQGFNYQDTAWHLSSLRYWLWHWYFQWTFIYEGAQSVWLKCWGLGDKSSGGDCGVGSGTESVPGRPSFRGKQPWVWMPVLPCTKWLIGSSCHLQGSVSPSTKWGGQSQPQEFSWWLNEMMHTQCLWGTC